MQLFPDFQNRMKTKNIALRFVSGFLTAKLRWRPCGQLWKSHAPGLGNRLSSAAGQ
jgi:hypothetical protein